MSNAEYDEQSMREAYQAEQDVDHAPLAERKEAQREFNEAMAEDPALVAERLGWLLEGNYGYGEMLRAKQILASPRMNRIAALNLYVGVSEWQCPRAMGIAAWKKLTPAQKQKLDQAISVVIAAAEKET